MKKFTYILLAIIIIAVAITTIKHQKVIAPVACSQEAKICPDGSAVGRIGPMCEFSACPIGTSSAATTLDDLIRVNLPLQNAKITSPLMITGEARGSWFFEASFPVTLVDWDGLIIGQGVAQAKGDWMTADFVPFEARITFDKPPYVGEQSKRGAIILRNDNPSGQASTSKSIEIPIVFQ